MPEKLSAQRLYYHESSINIGILKNRFVSLPLLELLLRVLPFRRRQMANPQFSDPGDHTSLQAPSGFQRQGSLIGFDLEALLVLLRQQFLRYSVVAHQAGGLQEDQRHLLGD